MSEMAPMSPVAQLPTTRGDKIQGHEVWQFANQKANGLATVRLKGPASRLKPVIALPVDIHLLVNKAQKDLDAAQQTPVENIRANVKILRDLGVIPGDRIDQIESDALQHAGEYGFVDGGGEDGQDE